MRLTYLGSRLALAAAIMGAIAPVSGCRSTPYIDQRTQYEVPREPSHATEDVAKADGPPNSDSKRDSEVQTAQYLANLPTPFPKVAKPRTTSDPESQEIWRMTLQEAIQIALQNSEVVRVIALGAQGIPVSGFEPVPLNAGAGGALGTGTLSSVYDPAIQETGIPKALANFDTWLNIKADWANQWYLNNNPFAGGVFSASKYPVLSNNQGYSAINGYQGGSPTLPFGGQTPSFGIDLTKKLATGAIVGVAQNTYWNYNNSPFNVYPSFWGVTNQVRFAQPLLGYSTGFGNNGVGGSANSGGLGLGYSGLEANRANIVVARLNADVSVWQFKAQIQAMVRSVEQQYWVLAQQYVRLWAMETAYDLSNKLLEDVQAKQEVGSRQGSRRDLADAKLQVENARLQLVAATNDVLTTERQLRNILGLPPADSRRIIPVTEPTDARLEPNWEASLAQMVTFHPEIIQQQLLVRVDEMALLQARNLLLPSLDFDVLYQLNGFGRNLDTAEGTAAGAMIKAINPLVAAQQRTAGLNAQAGNYNNFMSYNVGLVFAMPLGFRAQMANVRTQQYVLLRQRAFLQQVVHDKTHALARYFLEVDAEYKQYRAASRVKEATWTKLDYNKARYEAGDRDPTRSAEAVTILQYIDSINQWTNAVAQEAMYKSQYNTAIAVLEESKGTLLSYDNIAINEGPWPRKAYIQARDQQRAHVQHHIPQDGPYQPRPATGPLTPDPMPIMPPPNASSDPHRPALPAPAGPLGPGPNSAPPNIPAGLPNNILSGGASPATDAGVQPAGLSPVTPPSFLPPLPANSGSAGTPSPAPASTPSFLPPLPAGLPAANAASTAPVSGPASPTSTAPAADLPPLPPG